MRKKTVLHIEDDAEERSVIARLLRGQYRVVGRAQAEEAEALLPSQDMDAIILDLALPCMNGFEFLKKHREILRKRKIPVILTTGVEGRGIRELCKEHGCRAFLKKPLDHKALLRLLDRCCVREPAHS